ncbi:DUF3291 domain-containing protein [Paraferrimonas sp. SM1919]|uniref:DUF3291 domain-containing protein n=1 Tax=Paraferrimonas sp. SM1919 TaxID=2662263 RepID=UPI0013D70F97|nr:DUF3291 domain-containing protein [Paraferrimonas sp. SM1919]
MQLAQLNIAKAKYPLDSPEIKEFIANLDRVNGIAEQSKGFIWRLKDESPDTTDIQLFDDPRIIVNMSVWQSIESLKGFMFKTLHRDFMRRKSEWFERIDNNLVLWWVEDGHTPTQVEALERLRYLSRHGASRYAFTFKQSFEAVAAK